MLTAALVQYWEGYGRGGELQHVDVGVVVSSNLTKDQSLRKLEVSNEFHQVGDRARGDGSHHNVNVVVAATFKGCMPELMMMVDGVNIGV